MRSPPAEPSWLHTGSCRDGGLDPIWDGFLPGGRVFSSIGQSNALAAYLVLAIPLTAAGLFGRRALVRGLALAGVVAMVAALLFTFSRGGYLGLVAAGVVLAIGWRRELGAGSKRAAYAAAVLVAGAAVLGAGQARAAPEELGRVLDAGDESARIHVDMWRVAAHVAIDNPMLGTGPETFPLVFPRYSHAVLAEDRAAALDAYRVESPHDVYLAIAAGSGLPALAAYLGLLAASASLTLRAARTATREVRVLLVAVLAALVGHSVTDAFMTAERHEHVAGVGRDGSNTRGRRYAPAVSHGAYLLNLGLVPYAEAFALQRSLAGAVSQGAIPDTVVFLEHPPVVTDRPANRARQRAAHSRGNRGRGRRDGPRRQVDLPRRRASSSATRSSTSTSTARTSSSTSATSRSRSLRTLAAFEIEGERIEGLTGVWLTRPPRKIASIGVHVSRWVTTHGYALNVDLDPAPFTEWITACGLEDAAFTTMTRELGRPVTVEEVRPAAVEAIADVFGLELRGAAGGRPEPGLWPQPIHASLASR